MLKENSLSNFYNMLKENSLSNFYTKLCDIANESFTLSEKIPEFVFVRKIIRSLPDRFQLRPLPLKRARILTL